MYATKHNLQVRSLNRRKLANGSQSQRNSVLFFALGLGAKQVGIYTATNRERTSRLVLLCLYFFGMQTVHWGKAGRHLETEVLGVSVVRNDNKVVYQELLPYQAVIDRIVGTGNQCPRCKFTRVCSVAVVPKNTG